MTNSTLFLANNAILSQAGYDLDSFDALSPADATALVAQLNAPKGAAFSAPTSDVTVGKDPLAETDFDIAGVAVYLNTYITIGGTKLRMSGIKLTSKFNCLTGYNKETKQYSGINADVMSLIQMVRTHGAKLVNEHMTIEGSVGKAGETNHELVDPLAELLAKTTPLVV